MQVASAIHKMAWLGKPISWFRTHRIITGLMLSCSLGIGLGSLWLFRRKVAGVVILRFHMETTLWNEEFNSILSLPGVPLALLKSNPARYVKMHELIPPVRMVKVLQSLSTDQRLTVWDAAIQKNYVEGALKLIRADPALPQAIIDSSRKGQILLNQHFLPLSLGSPDSPEDKTGTAADSGQEESAAQINSAGGAANPIPHADPQSSKEAVRLNKGKGKVAVDPDLLESKEVASYIDRLLCIFRTDLKKGVLLPPNTFNEQIVDLGCLTL